jgi:hypothetical protein
LVFVHLLSENPYSVKVPSDVAQEKGFALWAKSLKAGGESSREHDPVIHAVYRLAGVVSMNKQYTTGEGSEEQGDCSF